MKWRWRGGPDKYFRWRESGRGTARSDADDRHEAASERDDWRNKISGDRFLNAVITTHAVTSAQGENVLFFSILSDVIASFPVRFHKRIRIKLVNTQGNRQL